ncbi:MAG: protein kinase, partial [Actinobacteria bacterium]|nr:protein kinase [Actinomycetota bacterium]
MPRRPAPAPPVAGRYVLLDEIGRGATGAVHRAWDVRHERYVAAKVLHDPDGSLLLRFVREQSLRIRHPHLLTPIGWAADDDLVLIAMDLVRGGSLLDLLRAHGPLPERFVAAVLEQLLAGLVAVHAAGLVHRDVKAANLLLEATGSDRPWVRLGDFGLACPLDDPVRLGSGPVGTPGYLSPEAERGAPARPAQDVYAAGAVGRRLLAGRAPLSTLLDSMTR